MTATKILPCLESLIISVDISVSACKGFRTTNYYLNQLAVSKDIYLIILPLDIKFRMTSNHHTMKHFWTNFRLFFF